MPSLEVIQQAESGHYLVSSAVERSLGQHWHLLRAPLRGVEIFGLSLPTPWGRWAGRIYTLEDIS